MGLFSRAAWVNCLQAEGWSEARVVTDDWGREVLLALKPQTSSENGVKSVS